MFIDAKHNLAVVVIFVTAALVATSCIAPSTTGSNLFGSLQTWGAAGNNQDVQKNKGNKPRGANTGNQSGASTKQKPTLATQTGITGVNVLLGCPTDSSVIVNVLSDADREVYFEYGTSMGNYSRQSVQSSVARMVPKTINIASLLPDTAYYYRIQYKTVADNQFTPGEEKLFHTQRARGSGYSFTVVADYHRDQNSDQEEIKVTFENIRKEQPDFSIDLGDTFMCEKFAGSYAATCARYIYDRNYFSIFGGSVPLYLVNGNHEGESGWLRDGTENNIAVWAAKARGQYYSCPANDGFYSGGTREETFIGKRTGYYSWEWGDALFVVLDPYWYTISNPKQGTESENWKWTLGLDQYMWLKKVLETSQSKYKFVFTHHVLGDVRGGIEWADLYEWGGHNRSGTWEFDKMRPGWDMPIHQLLVKNHVSILFQGHDHLYVRQEKDGLIYQEVPQPSVAASMSGAINDGSYKTGTIYSSPGHIRVSVSSDNLTVDYIHTALASDVSSKYRNGQTVYSYSLK